MNIYDYIYINNWQMIEKKDKSEINRGMKLFAKLDTWFEVRML
jgi:hypothetical protein